MVEKIMELNCIGVNITNPEILVKEIETQALRAERVAGCLNDLAWRNKYMSKETNQK
jgi:hypothetical protein